MTPRELLAALAPARADAALRQAESGVHKEVWFVGDEHMLRIARSDEEARKLAIEHRLLGLLDGHLGSIPVPVVEAVAVDVRADVCRRVPGRAPHWREWVTIPLEVKAGLGPPMGEAIGALHAAVAPAAVVDLGLGPHSSADLGWLDDLRGRTGSPQRDALIDRVDAAAAAAWPPFDPVVLHGDLGLNNVSIHPESGRLLGVFDFGGACIGDPHIDLRYDPIFEAGGEGMRPAYETTRGVELLPERVALFHAISALHNLSISIDHEPPELLAKRQGWVDAVAAWDPAQYAPA